MYRVSIQQLFSDGEGTYAEDQLAAYLTTAGNRSSVWGAQPNPTGPNSNAGSLRWRLTEHKSVATTGAKPHPADVLQRIATANTKHGGPSKASKQQARDESVRIHELEDALYVLKLAKGPRLRGRKPKGYRPVRNEVDANRLIRQGHLHRM